MANPLLRSKTPLSSKIVQQCEFYFGDVNLRKDGFLRQRIEESEDGWIAIAVLLTFNRLRALSDDEATIAEALRGSSLLEVSRDDTKVRRRDQKLPEDDADDTDARRTSGQTPGRTSGRTPGLTFDAPHPL